jgi:hypothetical protein
MPQGQPACPARFPDNQANCHLPLLCSYNGASNNWKVCYSPGCDALGDQTIVSAGPPTSLRRRRLQQLSAGTWPRGMFLGAHASIHPPLEGGCHGLWLGAGASVIASLCMHQPAQHQPCLRPVSDCDELAGSDTPLPGLGMAARSLKAAGDAFNCSIPTWKNGAGGLVGARCQLAAVHSLHGAPATGLPDAVAK